MDSVRLPEKKEEKQMETENKEIKILAIESSCDETAAAVVKN